MSRERQRALATLKHVQAVPATEHKRYASLTYKLPVLLRTAGLAQTVAYLVSRSKGDGKRLTLDLGERLGLPEKDPGEIFENIAKAKTDAYLALTAEALASADWYVRHVQAVLKIERTDVEENEE